MSQRRGQTRKSNTPKDVPTVEDVAQAAGVSTATVSRTLNAPDQVAKATKDRVMAAVQSLNYAPHFGARSLAAKRTNTFGAIVPTMENAIFAQGLQAFQEVLEAHGITLLVASSSYDVQLEEEQIRTLVARGADGLLLIGQDRTLDSYAFLERRNIPFVLAWSYIADPVRVCAGFDNETAMAKLTQEVLCLGHRRIAMITAPQNENDRARARVRGVKSALTAQGLCEKDLEIIETPYSISNGAAAFGQLMQQSDPPTVVMCGNDVLAAGALKKAKELDLHVPLDVSVTGFDDIELAEIVTPALTTVLVPHRSMGAAAAQKLIAMRNGEDPGENLNLDVEISLRESLGPVPK